MRVLLILSLLTVLYSCGNKESVTSPSGTIITGKLEGVSGKERILLQERQARNIVTVDTIVTDMEGNFTLGPNVPNYGFYRVFISNKNFINIILSPNDTLEVYAQADDLEGTYQVENSEETSLLKEFNDMMTVYMASADSLNQLLQTAQMQQDVQRYQMYYGAQMELNQSTGDKVRAFIRANSNMLASLSAVQGMDPEGDFELFELVAEGLKPKLGEQQLYTDFLARIEGIKRLMPGAQLPDITLPDPNGTPVSLYSVIGKVTLVDFWASWCKPCLAENPNVVAAHKKFSSKGFQVVGISLDRDAQAWKAAIQAGSLSWPHMSDLQFWQSAACQQYNVSSIPANFLIDGEGRIIAKNLRGQGLQDKLAELFAS